MPHLYRIALHFLQNEDGPAAVEYAVMLALLVMFCVGSLNSLGLKVGNTFGTVAAKLAPAGS